MSAATLQSAQVIARKSKSNFYLSFLTLPKVKRDAITAVYAFCREVDDAVDSAASPEEARQQLDAWKTELRNTYAGRPETAVGKSLVQAIDAFQLTRTYFEGILTGVGMDLERSRYDTFEQLQEYCYHVAGEVGLLCMEIFGFRTDRHKNYAVQLGTAFQLTNILRDVKTDALNGRIYLPLEDLKRFHVSEDDILNFRYTPAFIRLMRFEAGRARDFYRNADALPTDAEKPAIRAALVMEQVYAEILRQIEANGYNVFEYKIRLSLPQKIRLAFKAYFA